MASKKLSALITIGGAVASTLFGSIDRTKGKITELGSALRNAEQRQKMLSEAIKTFGKQGKDVDALRRKYEEITKHIEKMRAANERLLAVERARNANLEKQAVLSGQLAESAMIGAAIVLPTLGAFNKSAQFNYDLQAIGNTADMTQAKIKAMGVGLLTLSDNTGQSAETLKNALGFLVAAGQDVGTAQANLMAIGRTATATASSVEDVAKASFVMGDALKVEPAKMQKALDMLVQAGKEGNFEFKDMAAELPILAASFSALKMTGTEAVATMGAALQIGRKGAGTSAEAANNMANFLAKILSPETLGKAKKLNSDLYGIVSGAQARGENPLEAAIKEINRITKGGDQKLLGELFADMQVQNFLRPMLQNLDEYQRIKAKALGASGVSDRDFDKMLATSKQQVDELKNAFAGLVLKIGEAVEPAFAKLATVIRPIVIGARDLVQANPQLVGGVLVAAGAFTALRVAMIGVRLASTLLLGKMLSISALGARINAAMVLARSAMPGVAAGVRGISLALAATGIGLAITAIGTGAMVIRKYWDGIAAFFTGVGEGIAAGMSPIGELFVRLYDSSGKLKPVFDAIGSALSGIWNWFTNLMEPVKFTSDELTRAGVAGKAFGEMLAGALNLALTPLTMLIDGIAWINNNVGTAISKIAELNPFGEEAPVPAAVAALPAVPAMATGRAAAGYTDSSQNTINIYQQPGQNSKQLAEEITRQQEQRRAVMQRGALYDGAMAQ